ncbi:MAG: Flp family type IVb pilin [Alphaproteobacteria bacterium]|nr:Flp family type IVb pilin [Alphaproteobacteria bacterium]
MMKNLLASLVRLVKADSGVTAIEYGLIGALVGVVIISSLLALGLEINTNFNTIATSFNGTPSADHRPSADAGGGGGTGGTSGAGGGADDTAGPGGGGGDTVTGDGVGQADAGENTGGGADGTLPGAGQNGPVAAAGNGESGSSGTSGGSSLAGSGGNSDAAPAGHSEGSTGTNDLDIATASGGKGDGAASQDANSAQRFTAAGALDSGSGSLAGSAGSPSATGSSAAPGSDDSGAPDTVVGLTVPMMDGGANESWALAPEKAAAAGSAGEGRKAGKNSGGLSDVSSETKSWLGLLVLLVALYLIGANFRRAVQGAERMRQVREWRTNTASGNTS